MTKRPAADHSESDPEKQVALQKGRKRAQSSRSTHSTAACFSCLLSLVALSLPLLTALRSLLSFLLFKGEPFVLCLCPGHGVTPHRCASVCVDVPIIHRFSVGVRESNHCNPFSLSPGNEQANYSLSKNQNVRRRRGCSRDRQWIRNVQSRIRW